MKRVLLSILVIGILLVSACGAQTTAPTPAPAPPSTEPPEPAYKTNSMKLEKKK